MGHSPCYTHSSRKALPGLPTVHTLQASLAARIANTPAAPGQHGTLQKCNTPTASDRHLSFHPPWRRPPPHSFSCTRAPFAGAGLVPAWVVRSQRRRRRTPRFTWRSSSSSTSSPAGTRCPWWPPSSSEWVLEVSACFCDIATRVPARILW